MSYDRRRPTLRLTVTGSTLLDVLADARQRADAFFGDAAYEFVSCDATVLARAFDGQPVVYEADVVARTTPTSRRAPGAPLPPGHFDGNPDDTEEVPIP